MKSKIALSLRSDNWLLSRLDFIWSKYFSDIPQLSKVFIRFGRFAKYRLGSIRLKEQVLSFGNKKTKASFITITAMFADPNIPTEVIDHTIGHELVHYAHGFSSPSVRLHKYPHAGGVVRKEMKERGMEHLYSAYKAWMRAYRQSLRRRYGW